MSNVDDKNNVDTVINHDDIVNYPTEFSEFNECAWTPTWQLTIKSRISLIVLRNINQQWNETGCENFIEATIIKGKYKG